MDYLTLSNMLQSGEIGEDRLISAKDKVTLVIGGGDTGSDCVGTSTRMRARRVLQYEIMPKPPEWNEAVEPQLARVAQHPAHLQLPGRGVRAGLVHDHQVLQGQMER